MSTPVLHNSKYRQPPKLNKNNIKFKAILKLFLFNSYSILWTRNWFDVKISYEIGVLCCSEDESSYAKTVDTAFRWNQNLLKLHKQDSRTESNFTMQKRLFWFLSCRPQ